MVGSRNLTAAAAAAVVRKAPEVIVIGCTESVDGLDSLLLNAFEEKLCLPTTMSASCERLVVEQMEGRL
jgi:hypothetical protein